jgi:HSP90 family molecular chaperone
VIPTTTTNSISTNTTNPTQFQIADSSVLVELLSSKLYSNKIGSFIREIGTNALDANLSSGSTEPITIEIGKDGQTLTVAIGDTGAGMSPDTIASKLAVLGVSTKSEDNLAHGGYGIGFLTTLAVSRRIERKRRAFPFLAGREGLAAGGNESHP